MRRHRFAATLSSAVVQMNWPYSLTSILSLAKPDLMSGAVTRTGN